MPYYCIRNDDTLHVILRVNETISNKFLYPLFLVYSVIMKDMDINILTLYNNKFKVNEDDVFNNINFNKFIITKTDKHQ